MNNYVCNVKANEVFDYLREGLEVYAIADTDSLTNLKYASVDTVLEYISDDRYAFLYIRWGEYNELEK